MNYYNDCDPNAAAAIRQLVAESLIPDGFVDERPIQDVTPDELMKYDQCHFFAGACGWPVALALAGVASTTKLWTGSCPCQPFSTAGDGDGFADERHCWPYWKWLIKHCQPAKILGEQVAGGIASAWVDLVQTDLEDLGYAFGCVPFTAAGVGAFHVRKRNYWFAENPAHSERDQQSRQQPCGGTHGRMGWQQQPVPWNEPWESALSRFRTMADGVPRSVAACDLARNAIVPQQAAAFIRCAL